LPPDKHNIRKSILFEGNMSGENTMNKKVYFEMMRIIACGLVIMMIVNRFLLHSVDRR